MLSRAAGGMPFNGGVLMQRNSIVSAGSLANADTHAAYGCVDWYLYQNSPPVPAQSSSVLTSPAIAAPCSSIIIERAAAAAGAAVAAAAHGVSPAEACGW